MLKIDINTFYTGYLPAIIIGAAFLFLGPVINYYFNNLKASIIIGIIGVVILAGVLAFYLLSRDSGRSTEVAKLIDDASVLSLQDKLPDARKKIDQARALLLKEPDQIQSGRLELENGIIERVSGNISLARESLTKALSAFSEKNSSYRASTHLNIGRCLMQQDDRSGARKEFELSLGDSRALPDRLIEGQAAIELAELSVLDNQFDRALSSANEAETAFSSIDNKLGLGSVEKIRGMVELNRDRPNLAIPHLDRALAIYRELHSQVGQTNVLWHLGQARVHLQDFELARQNHSVSLQISQSIGYAIGIRNGYLALANLEALRNRPEQAAQEYRRAIDYFRSANDSLGESQAHLGLATVQIQSNDMAGAKVELERARNQVISLRDGSIQSEIEWNQAGLELREGNASSALIRYRKAYDLAQEVGSLSLQGRALRGLADALHMTGADDEADRTLVRARTVLLQAGVKDEAAMAGLSLASLRASRGDVKVCDLILTVIGEFEVVSRIDLVQLARQLSVQLKCGSTAAKPNDTAPSPRSN